MPPPIRPRAPNFSVTEVTLTAASPERHQRVIAKPDEVVTSFRLSGIIGGVMLHDPIAMVCTATNTVRLYVSITVNRRSLLEDRRGVNKWFTPNLNRHISHPAAPYISPRYVGVVGAHRQHQPSSCTGCINTRAGFWGRKPNVRFCPDKRGAQCSPWYGKTKTKQDQPSWSCLVLVLVWRSPRL